MGNVLLEIYLECGREYRKTEWWQFGKRNKLVYARAKIREHMNWDNFKSTPTD